MTEASTIGHCGEQDLAALTSGNALTPPSASTQVPETKRLLFGPYSPPLIAKGGVLYCERRGKLEVGSYSHAPIPWPMKKGKHSIILCGDLVKAVKLESVEAVAYHWNVSRALVQSWRKILHVPEFNPGTRILRAAIELALRPAKRSRSLERWRHPHEKLPRPTPEPRELRRPAASIVLKHQIAHTHRHPNPDLRLWTEAEEKLLGTAPDERIAEQIQRTLSAVRARRNLLGIPTYLRSYIRVWTPEEDRLLGTKPDRELAKSLHRSVKTVLARRVSLGVPYTQRVKRPWTPEEVSRLGTQPDEEVARLIGRSLGAVRQHRAAIIIPNPSSKRRPWSEEELRLLSTNADSLVAKLTGRTVRAVKLKRFKLRQPSNRTWSGTQSQQTLPAKSAFDGS